jgi:hypothetical protein
MRNAIVFCMKSFASAWVPAWLLVLGLSLAGCSGLSRQASMPVPPDKLEGGWARTGLESPPLDQAPEALRSLKPTEWARVGYQRAWSGSVVLVDGYAMQSESSAFEAQQKWRNEPGTVAFRKGRVFVVLASSTESTQALVDFSKRLEREWLGAVR